MIVHRQNTYTLLDGKLYILRHTLKGTVFTYCDDLKLFPKYSSLVPGHSIGTYYSVLIVLAVMRLASYAQSMKHYLKNTETVHIELDAKQTQYTSLKVSTPRLLLQKDFVKFKI